MSYEDRIYDVVIMGGGPAGATLGARIARETSLSVAIFEAEYFPRDHIGESFVHTIVPSLTESGALPKILASQCWVKKFGGYYAWSERPWATYFDHALYERDGKHRWAVHANRPEMDQILLDHARDAGAEVYEGTAIVDVKREQDTTLIDLGTAGTTRCRIFVNCSGRTSSTTITGKKAFLSEYRNVAVWNHIVEGQFAQTLQGDWNIFREKNISSIGSFAFQDGWFWYIPVPKIVQGKRVITHSLGLVTDPAVLRLPGKRFTETECFVKAAKSVPFLRDLIGDVKLVSDKFFTAANYSRISDRMCDFDTGEIRVGDAALFVDPLFSSGVHFALLHAGAALVLIKNRFNGALTEPMQRELWNDYHNMLSTIGRGFALGIDQWYNEISNQHPDSIYWTKRGSTPTFAAREETFAGLINGSIHGDLLQVISKGTNSIDSLGKEGAMRRTVKLLQDKEPARDARVTLKPNVGLKHSVTLEAPAVLDGKPAPFIHTAYWDDPEAHKHDVRQLFPGPIPCKRFYFTDSDGENEVRFFEQEHHGSEIFERLQGRSEPYGTLYDSLSTAQQHILIHLLASEMIQTV